MLLAYCANAALAELIDAAAAGVALQRRAAGAPLASHEIGFQHDEMRILAYNRAVADLSGLAPDALLAQVGVSFGVEPSAAALQAAALETFGMLVADRWPL